MKRETQKLLLEKSGPWKKGRPALSPNEKSVQIQTRVPETVALRMGDTAKERNALTQKILMTKYRGKIKKRPEDDRSFKEGQKA